VHTAITNVCLHKSCEIIYLFRNALTNPKHKWTIDTFTLFILDECHNTIKEHPFAGNHLLNYLINVLFNNLELMQLYGVRYGQNHTTAPQIVGFTASLGTGKNEKEALVNIWQ
jgi:hypothetical protein